MNMLVFISLSVSLFPTIQTLDQIYHIPHFPVPTLISHIPNCHLNNRSQLVASCTDTRAVPLPTHFISCIYSPPLLPHLSIPSNANFLNNRILMQRQRTLILRWAAERRRQQSQSCASWVKEHGVGHDDAIEVLDGGGRVRTGVHLVDR